MTENEWLTTTTAPGKMLRKVAPVRGRKTQLAACGICRLISVYSNLEEAIDAVERAERYSDGRVDVKLSMLQARFSQWADGLHEDADRAASRAAWSALWAANPEYLRAALTAAERTLHLRFDGVREHKLQGAKAKFRAEACEVFREVFGNPFRERPYFAVSAEALAIARAIRTEANFSLMPILADALDDAGCPDAELVAHCREPRQHRPGCWALDAVLGLK